MWNPFKQKLVEVEVVSIREYQYSLKDDWGSSESYMACDILVRDPNDEIWFKKFRATRVWDLSRGTKFKTSLKGWAKI